MEKQIELFLNFILTTIPGGGIIKIQKIPDRGI